MQSQRWMFTSPGGEDEYKRPSVTREHYDAVIKAKDELTLTETGKLKYMAGVFIHFLNFKCCCCIFIFEEQKRLEFECLLWKKMTEKVLDQFEKRQQFINEIPKICSTYKDSYDKGFKVRELGTKIGEEVSLSKKKL